MKNKYQIQRALEDLTLAKSEYKRIKQYGTVDELTEVYHWWRRLRNRYKWVEPQKHCM